MADTDARAIAFLDSVMLTHRSPTTGVVAIPPDLPSHRPVGGRHDRPEPGRPGPGTTSAWSSTHRQTVTSGGGNPAVAGKLDPAYQSQLCDPMPATDEPGTAAYQTTPATGATLMGAVKVTAHLTVVGDYPELVGRLWDVVPRRDPPDRGPGRRAARTSNQAAGTSRRPRANETLTFDLEPERLHLRRRPHHPARAGGQHRPVVPPVQRHLHGSPSTTSRRPSPTTGRADRRDRVGARYARRPIQVDQAGDDGHQHHDA